MSDAEKKQLNLEEKNTIIARIASISGTDLDSELTILHANQIPDKPYGEGTHFSKSLKFACDWKNRDITGEVIESINTAKASLEAAKIMIREKTQFVKENYDDHPSSEVLGILREVGAALGGGVAGRTGKEEKEEK